MHNLLSRIVIVNILLYSESTGSYCLVYSHKWSEYSNIYIFNVTIRGSNRGSLNRFLILINIDSLNLAEIEFTNVRNS